MQGHSTVLVRRSKTDNEGWVAYLVRDTVNLVRTWLDRSGISDGQLF